ncbi:MAG: hypothetical protein ACO3MW_10755, partial [Rhodospirillales bacterium]
MILRSTFLKLLGAAGLAATVPGMTDAAAAPKMRTRPIPKTGEALPVIGLGTWLGFDVGGQSIKAVRVDADGEVLAEVRLATGPETDVEALVTRLRQGSAALEGGTPLP